MLTETEDRLQNWARYYRRGHVQQTCGSVEGRYRAPWRQWVSLADIPHPEPIDVHDAQRVEVAWRSLSWRHRRMLKGAFIYQEADHVLARTVRLPVWKLAEAYRAAVVAIGQVLTCPIDKPQAIGTNYVEIRCSVII